MSEIVWTRRSPSLWTGRLDDRPAGTIEHGTFFTYVDLDGVRRGPFDSLDAAKAAGQATSEVVIPRRSGRIWPVIAIASALVLALAIQLAMVLR